MNKLLLATSIPIFVLAVCRILLPADVRAQDQLQYANVNGDLRSFVVHLPIGYESKNKYPLVILLHSTDQTAQDMARLSRFDFLADRYGFITFYPVSDDVRWDIGVTAAQPKRTGHNRGGSAADDMSSSTPFPMLWPDPAQPGIGVDGAGSQGRGTKGKNQAGDVAFFDEMLDKLIATYSIDANRVFAVGYSDGGLMDFRLGCSLSGRIAAIAPVAAAMPKAMTAKCQLSRGVPLLMMNGTSDPVVHYDGGRIKDTDLITLSVRTTAETWAQLDRCSQKPTQTSLPPHSKNGMKTNVDTYSNCRDGAEVTLYTIEGGGNTWPSGDEFNSEKEVGKTSTDVDADEVIWKFFNAHPMVSSPSARN